MKYSTLLKRFRELKNLEPTELANVIGIRPNSMSGRRDRDSEFSEREILLIEQYYNIDFYNNDECENDNFIVLEHIHINPSCGTGTMVFDDAEITPVKLGKEIINDIWQVNPAYLKLFKASGDSMQPRINDGDILLIDISKTDYNNGGIFLLTINNDWFIKRLRLRVTGELDIISDNDKYPIETLSLANNIDIQIKGRIIKNLSEKL